MVRAVALLRSINVAGRAAGSAQLVGAGGALGLTGVSTFLASGNILFDLPEPAPGDRSVPGPDLAAWETRWQDVLQERLGFAVPTFLRTQGQLTALAGSVPFPGIDPGANVQVVFLTSAPTVAAAAAVRALTSSRDELALEGRQVWWLAHDGVGRSALRPGALDRAAGQPVTVRSLNTVRRLVRLLDR